MDKSKAGHLALQARKLFAFKNLVAILVATFIFSSLTSVANAATPISGHLCKVHKQVKIVGSKKFSCSKTGKKYRWKVSIVKAIPKVTPTPTPKTFSAPIPITLPISAGTDPNSITFANIVSRVADIPQVAWQKSQQVLASNQNASVTIEMHVGPNTVLDFPGGQEQIRQVIEKTAKFWNGFSITKFISVYAYNSADEPWAEQQWQATAQRRNYLYPTGFRNAIRGNCQSSSAPGQFNGPVGECGGSAAGLVYKSQDAAMSLGMVGNSTDIYFLTGALVGHEFTHTVQNANWIGAPECSTTGKNCFSSSNDFAPCWINEGQANIMGRLIVSSTLEDYNLSRKGLPYGWGPTTVTDYSQASLRDYLFNQHAPTCYQNGALYRLGYSIGALTTEALTAIGGPQATMALYSLGADGYDFDTAFKRIYGISWAEASTILSNVLAAEYLQAGPPPF